MNGVALDEPYLSLPQAESRAAAEDFEVTVPEGSLWVMGDNRYYSQDSRAHTDEPGHGFVPLSDVVGRAFATTWPVSRWIWLDNYPDTFATIPPPPG